MRGHRPFYAEKNGDGIFLDSKVEKQRDVLFHLSKGSEVIHIYVSTKQDVKVFVY